jgi:DNA-binding transcriptional LysR family regulator
MLQRDLEIDLLRAFIAAVESGSFTAAAEIVGRSQSAVSQKILRLEDILGCRVFERSNRTLTLTSEGERLVGLARQILEFNDAALQLFADPITGKIRLGISDDFIPHHLPGLIARLGEANPGVVLELRTGCGTELFAAFEEGHLDLAIAGRGTPVQTGRIIWREPLCWVAAEEFSIGLDEPIPLVVLPPPCRYRNVIFQTLEAARRAGVVTCTSSTLSGVQLAVKNGLGVTVLGKSFIQAGLKILPASASWPPLPMTEIILLGEERVPAGIVESLISFVTDSLAIQQGVAD